MEAAELLLEKTPKIIRPSSHQSPHREDLLRDINDLRHAEYIVETVAVLGKVYDSLAPKPDYLQSILWRRGQIRDLADVTIGSMLWTAAAHFIIQGEWAVEPIPVRAWSTLFPLVSGQTMRRVLGQWIERSFDGSDAGCIEAYLAHLLAAYQDEVGAFEGGNPPDAGLVKFFLFRE